MTSYPTFWIICGLYFLTLGFITASGMEILKWISQKFVEFGSSINIDRIPLYHFPDIWQNLIWVSGLFKIVLAVMVIISITNEYQYRTLRQNVIDGMSRFELLLSKILSNIVLSLMSVVMVCVIIIITGMIYSPEIIWNEVISGTEFLIAYLIEIFTFLSFALMLGMFIKRSGLTIVVLMLSNFIEIVIKFKLFNDNWEESKYSWIKSFFPLESISNLVPLPFARYAFQEIQDHINIWSLVIALVWAFLFNYFSYLKLQYSDI